MSDTLPRSAPDQATASDAAVADEVASADVFSSARRQSVVVVGSGVVGTATGLGLVEKGHDVVFCDVSAERRALLGQRGLISLDAHALPNEQRDVYLISVPSPTAEGRVETSFVAAAATSVGQALRLHSGWPLVVVRSTVPPGTTEDVVRPILERTSGRSAGRGFGLCMNPEFLRELTAEGDFMNPRVIVIGAFDKRSDRALRGLYAGWPDVPVISMSLRAAELTKYTSNLFNAAKISFFNEIEQVCRALDVDARHVFAAVTSGAEGLWNAEYGTRGLAPYGGACLPKDTVGFLGFACERGFDGQMLMLRATIETNERLEADNHAMRSSTWVDGRQAEAS